ncbi:hypothetical protein [Polyangium sp. 6x1]|uniref:hypothetical protein n=1 Tax=Polyangium sp. 6x1 TaxID=3042689 RepID=UPI0024828513|nr:hypothetical protein [Polyangium sp. 6x1]MDI1444238.1 hypothetical protein [Polyangium sp. 6x1]
MFRPRSVSLAAASLATLAPSVALADPSCPHMFANKVCVFMTLFALGFFAVPIGVVGLLSMAALRVFHVIGEGRRFPLAIVANFPLAFFTLFACQAAADAAYLAHPDSERWGGGVTLGVPLLVQTAYVVLVARAFRIRKT